YYILVSGAIPHLLSFPTRRSSDLQIRVQFANAGFPLVGDMKYNKERRTRKRVDVGLFSAGLSFKPYKNKEIFEFFEMPESYPFRSEEHTSELQSRFDLVCSLLIET